MAMQKPRVVRVRRSYGLSLIELMVAMTVGMMILVSLVSIFASTSRARGELEKTSRQIENGRYAVQVLSDDLSNAGYFAGAILPNPVGAANLCDPVITSTTLPLYVLGAQGVAADLTCTTAVTTGTDVLMVRRLSTCAVGEADCAGFAAGHPHVQVHACQTPVGGVQVGQPVLAADEDEMVGQARDCAAVAPIRRVLTHVYYVDTSARLVRRELQGGAFTAVAQSVIAEGIERLHFEYGLDTDNNGVIDAWSGLPASLAQWQQVLAVRVHLLARNLDPTPGYNHDRSYTLGTAAAYSPADNFKRQAYSTTVRLNNPGGRFE